MVEQQQQQHDESTFLENIINGLSDRRSTLTHRREQPPTSTLPAPASADPYYAMVNPLTGNGYSPKYWKLLEQREKLPVWEKKAEFMQLLDEQQCILVEAETGSGKTTQIPQWCLEWLRKKYPDGRGVVCCTQPRRLAAIRVARRVAEEMDVKLGSEVGYSVRFELLTNSQTKLKYCTDGVLLADSTQDRSLDQYDIIVLDEVHERTLTTDVMMGLVKIMSSPKFYSIKADWVLYTDAVQHRDKVHYLQMVSFVDAGWLMELAPSYFGRIPESTELRKRLAEAYNPNICQYFIAQ